MSTIKAGKIQPPGDSDPLQIFTNTVERITVTSGGLVGVGTASPTSMLHVAGTANITSGVTLDSTLNVGGLATLAGANITSGVTLSSTLTVGTATMAVPSGNAPVFGARAWVNFNGLFGATLGGTYTQSATTVTVGATAHGLIVGNRVFVEITSGSGVKTVGRTGGSIVTAVTNANTFTYTAGTSLGASGTLSLLRDVIRGSGNVSSIVDNGVGDYIINFMTPMPDVNYNVTLGGARRSWETLMGFGVGQSDGLADYDYRCIIAGSGPHYTVSSVRVGFRPATGSAGESDADTFCATVFR